jgi:hypothetical protein
MGAPTFTMGPPIYTKGVPIYTMGVPTYMLGLPNFTKCIVGVPIQVLISTYIYRYHSNTT